MPKAGIIGNFAINKDAKGGQTIRTRVVTNELQDIYGKDEIILLDTENWKRQKFTMFLNCVKIAIQCKNIIILPAHNGIKVFIPLFVILKAVFRKKLHYIVIGAWLANDLEDRNLLRYFTKKIDFVYVQTETLKTNLEKINVINTFIFPNFKKILPIENYVGNESNLSNNKLCTFSRVNEEKGIKAAIKVIRKINIDMDLNICLDIYGPVDPRFEEEFFNLVLENKEYINYKGSVDYNQSIAILNKYFLLLFPTRYYTEGFPGTIVDSFLAGTPVLASRWESCYDILSEGITGTTYNFNDEADFEYQLIKLLNDNELVNKMKKNCIEESKKYTSTKVIGILTENFR